MVFVDDLVAHPELKSGSGGFLGCEERFEESAADLRSHAGSVVGHRNPYSGDAGTVPVTRSAGANDKAAAAGDGVHRIAHEVSDDLADFSFEAEEGRAITVFAIDLDMQGIQAPLVEVENGVDECPNVG